MRRLGMRLAIAAGLLSLDVPLVVQAEEPRFQTFGLADLSDSEALEVSDDGCTLVARAGPPGAPDPYHRLHHRRVAPLLDLAGGEEVTFVSGMTGDGETVVGRTRLGHNVESYVWCEPVSGPDFREQQGRYREFA